jgi:iron complex transport system substrate-binding protein
MASDFNDHEAPTRGESRAPERAGSRPKSAGSERTRREYVKYGGAVLGAGLLAGCTGDTESGSDSTPTGGTDTASPTETETEDATATETAYEVCMEPNGCHSFDSVPERFMVYHQGPVDMMISLG